MEKIINSLIQNSMIIFNFSFDEIEPLEKYAVFAKILKIGQRFSAKNFLFYKRNLNIT